MPSWTYWRLVVHRQFQLFLFTVNCQQTWESHTPVLADLSLIPWLGTQEGCWEQLGQFSTQRMVPNPFILKCTPIYIHTFSQLGWRSAQYSSVTRYTYTSSLIEGHWVVNIPTSPLSHHTPANKYIHLNTYYTMYYHF